MNRRRVTLFFLLLAIFFLVFYPSKKQKYTHNQGKIFGTYYSVIYQQPEGEDLHEQIKQQLDKVDASLSMFNDTSVISRINRNEDVVVDDLFVKMYQVAHDVSTLTHGAFDITVAPLVTFWGFGKATSHDVDINALDSIRKLVGYQLIELRDGRIYKQNPAITLDASAIAKGYGSDIVAQFLKEQGCKNYMVEIGGEVVCHGKNEKGKPWRIGINKPIEDTTGMVNEIEEVLHLTDKAVATSGNYRQFYYKEGKKYAHTIDPRTGQPVQHNLLSATVIAPTCMAADAWATAFMVLGPHVADSLAATLDQIECMFICVDEQGKYQVTKTDGFDKYTKD